MTEHARPVMLMLNVGHALDHLVLLIFATAVAAIAVDFGISRWEDLMPFGAGAFLMFGLGSLPAGKLGDSWGRRQMMLVFFFGMGASALLCALATGPWTLAAALTLMGTFSAIYHPVGIPMLVQGATRPGAVIGVNGLAGNLGIAVAALLTGALVQWAGWRAAFVVPGIACLVLGLVFWRVCPRETEAPAARKRAGGGSLSRQELTRVFVVLTVAAASGNVIFNTTTNGNAQLLAERFAGIVESPSTLGLMLAAVYAVASLAQVVVGRLIDRVPLKRLQLGIVAAQVPLLLLASQAQGWWLFATLVATMVVIFGAIPFTDAVIVRYVDDRIRSRVAGMRLTLSIGLSSVAVWALGPAVKAAGFGTLMAAMAAFALVTALAVSALPAEHARSPVLA
jgi:MFS family permease